MSTIPCETCTHGILAHQSDTDGKVGPCRVTGCECTAFVEPPREPVEAEPRRVCIDVPDGYVLSVSLIPHQPLEQEDAS